MCICVCVSMMAIDQLSIPSYAQPHKFHIPPFFTRSHEHSHSFTHQPLCSRSSLTALHSSNSSPTLNPISCSQLSPVDLIPFNNDKAVLSAQRKLAAVHFGLCAARLTLRISRCNPWAITASRNQAMLSPLSNSGWDIACLCPCSIVRLERIR